MHIHILGICGTFMGGLARLARQSGHTVTGCDSHVYPPMSTQLEQEGITLIEGYSADQILLKPDLYIIGNALSRGNPLVEAILDQRLPYTSGPQWLGDYILKGKWVLGIAGTHGKTSTTSILSWILEEAGYTPGFLVGGVPVNFGVSARLGKKKKGNSGAEEHYFVIEADEYDTAFFDKRSKFVHYRPNTLILNNLEYDHADIFPDLSAIETQFHHLVRTVPKHGRLIVNSGEPALKRVLERGCWSETRFFAHPEAWHFKENVLYEGSQAYGPLEWDLLGTHNQNNALAAIAAAQHIGISPQDALSSLTRFRGIKRRMEIVGKVRQITIYDDFAHHPTAIQTTIEGLRQRVGKARILAVLEPRSNTMKLGAMKAALPASLALADHVFIYTETQGKNVLEWDASQVFSGFKDKIETFTDLQRLIKVLTEFAEPEDHILIMSNGSFGGIHQDLLKSLNTLHKPL